MTSYKPSFVSIRTYLKIWSDRTPQALNLLSSLTEGDFNSRTIINHKAKGFRSPKLSKALIQCGIPTYIIEALLATGDTTSTSHVVSKYGPESDYYKRLTVLHQSYSDHFRSCQHPDGKGDSEDGNYKVPGDIIDFEAGELFFWVVGDPKNDGLNLEVGSKDGFRARAKLALVYSDSRYKKVAGLFIDRVYGQSGILDLRELQEWWSAFCVERQLGELPIYHCKYDSTDDNEPLYCRATHGYTDNRSKVFRSYEEVTTSSVWKSLYMKHRGIHARVRGQSVLNSAWVMFSDYDVPPTKSLYLHAQSGTNWVKEKKSAFVTDYYSQVKHKVIPQRQLLAKFVAACKAKGIDFRVSKGEVRSEFAYGYLEGQYCSIQYNVKDQTVRIRNGYETLSFEAGELRLVYGDYCDVSQGETVKYIWANNPGIADVYAPRNDRLTIVTIEGDTDTVWMTNDIANVYGGNYYRRVHLRDADGEAPGLYADTNRYGYRYPEPLSSREYHLERQALAEGAVL